MPLSWRDLFDGVVEVWIRLLRLKRSILTFAARLEFHFLSNIRTYKREVGFVAAILASSPVVFVSTPLYSFQTISHPKKKRQKLEKSSMDQEGADEGAPNANVAVVAAIDVLPEAILHLIFEFLIGPHKILSFPWWWLRRETTPRCPSMYVYRCCWRAYAALRCVLCESAMENTH